MNVKDLITDQNKPYVISALGGFSFGCLLGIALSSSFPSTKPQSKPNESKETPPKPKLPKYCHKVTTETSGESVWFSESETTMWKGQRMSLKILPVSENEYSLLDTKSEYQHIQVFQTESYGKMLVLDGVIQLTERDESAYQEMLVHVPLFSHVNPKKVLIIGGGDGGILREVCKHKSVEEIVMVELDKGVVDASKRFFSESMATSFDDPRLTLLFQDGAAYCKAKENKGKFDIVLVDSSDPIGPADVLFANEFYDSLHHVLNSNGIACTQGECQFLHRDLIDSCLRYARSSKCGFKGVRYFYTCVPTYPSGQIGFFLLQKQKHREKSKEEKKLENRRYEEIDGLFNYYNKEIHNASFCLPTFMHGVGEGAAPKDREEAAKTGWWLW